jgi:hypothetical protein
MGVYEMYDTDLGLFDGYDTGLRLDNTYGIETVLYAFQSWEHTDTSDLVTIIYNFNLNNGVTLKRTITVTQDATCKDS